MHQAWLTCQAVIQHMVAQEFEAAVAHAVTVAERNIEAAQRNIERVRAKGRDGEGDSDSAGDFDVSERIESGASSGEAAVSEDAVNEAAVGDTAAGPTVSGTGSDGEASVDAAGSAVDGGCRGLSRDRMG